MKNFFIFITFCCCFLLSGEVAAQVTVGAGTKPEDFSVLEVSTDNLKGGLRLPQLTTAQRDALNMGGRGLLQSQSALGLTIFNTDTYCLNIWSGYDWVEYCSGTSNDKRPSSNGTAVVSAWDCSGSLAGKATAGIDVSTTGLTKTVTAVVQKTGTYNLTIVNNGITFSGSGTFNGTGLQTVTLSASGVPLQAGKNFEFALNTIPSCSFFVDVLNDPSTNGTAGVSAWDCSGDLNGTAYAGQSINMAKTITANVTRVGTYNISITNGGITFTAAGLFTGTGTQRVILVASGTPTLAGPLNFALNTTPGCSFSLNVLDPSSNGTASMTPDCGSGGFSNTPVTVGIAPTNALTLTVRFYVTKAGSYAISSTANGLTFSGAGNVAQGFQNIVLYPSGTPTVTGTNIFRLNTTPTCEFMLNVSENVLPVVLSSKSAAICGSGSADLEAQPNPGATIDWYGSATGGSVLTNGAGTLTYHATASSAGTQSFWAQARRISDGVVSATRTEVKLQANALPAAASNLLATPSSVYIGGTSVISATQSEGINGVINWYDQAQNGVPVVQASNSFTTPALSSAATYYAEVVNQVTGCKSATRPSVTVSTQALPVLNVSATSTCGSGVVNFTASVTNGTNFQWFSASTNALVATGASYSPSISSSTTLYAKAVVNGTTITSNPVTAIVNAAPSATYSAAVTSAISQSASLSITPQGGSGSYTIVWKDNSGNPVGSSSNNYTTATFSTAGTYVYTVQVTDKTTGCTSPAYQITVTVPSDIETTNCGAYIGTGNWKSFLCYNVGATKTADMKMPSTAADFGSMFQWGSSKAYSSTGTVSGWNTTGTSDTGAWNGTTKTANDPCPKGYRIPTLSEWSGLTSYYNNNKDYSRSGSWTSLTSGFNSAVKIGSSLVLPAVGFRDSTGALTSSGLEVRYWSSSSASGLTSGSLYIDQNPQGIIQTPSYPRAAGLPIRCIAQ